MHSLVHPFFFPLGVSTPHPPIKGMIDSYYCISNVILAQEQGFNYINISSLYEYYMFCKNSGLYAIKHNVLCKSTGIGVMLT